MVLVEFKPFANAAISSTTEDSYQLDFQEPLTATNPSAGGQLLSRGLFH